jgi:4-diphosphocytidyl-2-C-methyl-D-erythritol kinase
MDGFHNLETLMIPIPLSDLITLNPIRKNTTTPIKFTTTGLAIDGSADNNLISKAFRLLDADFKLPATAIHLHKSIPFGAGLGGGSADGAFTITALNDLYQLNLSTPQMETYAAKLGSDCAFFIQNKPAIATGRGELLKHIPLEIKNYYLMIVIPPTGISTKEAYSSIKPKEPKHRIAEHWKKDMNYWAKYLTNDFEDSVYQQKPAIKKVKEKLYEQGAVYASLSGSGAASFGFFKEKPDLKNIFPKNYFVWGSLL